MTYSVKEEVNILEKATDTIVQVCNSEEEARSLCRSLNLGSGFNGYTPNFFTQSFKQRKRPSIYRRPST